MASISELGFLNGLRTHVKRQAVQIAAVAVVAARIVMFDAAAAYSQDHSPTRLQPLLNDAVAQLEISYRYDWTELERRYQIVSQAVVAWNKSSRDAVNNQRLADWLRAVMQSSMPGSQQALPPIPEFETEPVETEPLPTPSVDRPQAAPESPTESAGAEHADTRADAPTGASLEEPAATTTPTPAEPMETPSAQTMDVRKPVVVDEGDPFRDDPLPGEDAVLIESAQPNDN